METLERLRGAIRLSLWMWALYWPLAGLMLLAAGMSDPASILVLLVLVATFLSLLVSGLLKGQGGGKVRAFVKGRPIYLVAAAGGVLVLGSVVNTVANLGLALFAIAYLASMASILRRLLQHTRATGETLVSSRGDQLALLIGMALLLSLPLALDMLLQLLAPGSTAGTPSAVVAALNLFHIAYPPLVMVAARPFLDLAPRSARRRFRYRIVREPAVAPEAEA